MNDGKLTDNQVLSVNKNIYNMALYLIFILIKISLMF